MSTLELVAGQTVTLGQDGALNVSRHMGQIVGVLILAIIVIWVVQKARGKKG
jgi:hypothetical protein